MSKYLPSLLRISGLVIFLILAGFFALTLINNRPVEFTSGLLAVAGAVAALSALAYTHAGTLEQPSKSWVNREARNLFLGALIWGYAAFLGYVYSLLFSTSYPAWFAWPMFVIYIILLGTLLVFAAFFTLSAVEYMTDALMDQDQINDLENRRSKGRLARILGRSKSLTALKPSEPTRE